jgi:hypothetical protein
MDERISPPPDEATVPDTPPATAATAQSQGGGSPPGGDPASGAASADDDAGPSIQFRLGARLRWAAQTPRYERKSGDPVYRPLKIYTIDPSRRRREGQTAEINVPYEYLRKGPNGCRFRVVKSETWPLQPYDDVNLNDTRLLINNGHEPAPTDPVFHHQMVYAVAMTTYAIFRSALGREVSWGFPGAKLNLIPHAFQDANAQYIRDRQSLEFGWYRVEPSNQVDMPGGALIFSCLSHDVIAHELTHALLDGLRVRFDRASNPDVGAFHEGFADLVALLQRFSYRMVVRSIILSTQGDLTREGDWTRLVFEMARGKGGASLRSIDLDGVYRYREGAEEHDLGTILVSAILDAFVTIYTHKAGPIIRLATGGRNTLAEGEAMSADLITQLTHIASRLSTHLLNMCIRAIDYCPPVDITLGEYLRALITADFDLVPDDQWSYREALIDAFRKRHIFPQGVAALSEDALLWQRPSPAIVIPGLNFGDLRFSADPGCAADAEEVLRQAREIGKTICRPENLEIFGLADPKDEYFAPDKVDPPVVESVRTLRRVGPDGQLAFGLVAEVIQRRYVAGGGGYPAFRYRGGSTIIIGALGEVRYVIAKYIKSETRLLRQREYAALAGADVFALQSCRHQQSGKTAAPPPASGTAARGKPATTMARGKKPTAKKAG